MSESTRNAYSLLWSHQYDDAFEAARRRLLVVPDDLEATGTAASALIALGRYQQVPPYLEKLDAVERADRAAPGRPGQRMTIACLHWMQGNRELAISGMRELVDGILNRSINYGDGAGGVSQGLLLYYMATTAHDEGNVWHALRYMKNRAKRRAIQLWPGPVALHYLGEVDFDVVLQAATGEPNLDRALDEARTNLRKRRDLCVALFHDGTRHRAEGNEAACMERMRLCHSLENPIIENEWYLARYEVKQATRPAVS